MQSVILIFLNLSNSCLVFFSFLSFFFSSKFYFEFFHRFLGNVLHGKKKQLNINQLLNEAFCDIQTNHGRSKGYWPAEADNPYRDLDYTGYHKNRI